MREFPLVRSMLVGSALLALAAPVAHAQPTSSSGGQAYEATTRSAAPVTPGAVAQIVDGVAQAPADAPEAVKQVIAAGNRIVGMPYRYGGGHGPGFTDTGYDCSGSMSFALNGGGLLKRPLNSTGFMRYGQRGAGTWITIYTRSSHAYLTVAGIRLDTSAADDPGGAKGPRWRPLRPSDAGYTVRHPAGL